VTDLQRTIHAVYRLEAAKLVAGLARIVRDVALAEELAHDALVAALERWPEIGVPDNPGAWLMTTAKRRAFNTLGRAQMIDRKHEALGHELAADDERGYPTMLDEDLGDDLLRLVFVACHPVLSSDARVALTLRLLGGLTTDEIARAFLVPEPTIAQRIVRAKKTLTEAGVAFEVPPRDALGERLASVLSVIYLIFNEGYSAPAGADVMRPDLCEEALRLGRVLAELVPDEPEVHGLVAMMELHASRLATRLGRNGHPVLLLDQDRSRWDRLLIRRGLAALERAEALGGARGPYAIHAAISACHARAHFAADTDWARIAELYGDLARTTPSAVIELNRAMAVAMASGPADGLAILDQLVDEPTLAEYHLLPSARGDLLAKLGRFAEASAELEKAAALARNDHDREQLRARAAECVRSAK
jgi:RNA polymerase sigma factor (sigma-70 family)